MSKTTNWKSIANSCASHIKLDQAGLNNATDSQVRAIVNLVSIYKIKVNFHKFFAEDGKVQAHECIASILSARDEKRLTRRSKQLDKAPLFEMMREAEKAAYGHEEKAPVVNDDLTKRRRMVMESTLKSIRKTGHLSVEGFEVELKGTTWMVRGQKSDRAGVKACVKELVLQTIN